MKYVILPLIAGIIGALSGFLLPMGWNIAVSLIVGFLIGYFGLPWFNKIFEK
jgi:hypothetical protein